MNPATPLRILCGIAMVSYLIELGLMVDRNRIFAVIVPLSLAIVFCVGPLLGVALLSRPARLFFPFTIFFQYGFSRLPVFFGYSITVIPGLVGFFTSLIILTLLFTFPTKQLFIPRDPDAPVL
jgi:hypothetical protein